MNSDEAIPETGQDVVFGGSARVPLGISVHADGEADAAPARPFGLRFARTLPGAEVAVPPSRFCPDRQIAMTVDGSDSPWYRVVSTSMTTTGQSTDGGGSTGGEEWTPDQGMLG